MHLLFLSAVPAFECKVVSLGAIVESVARDEGLAGSRAGRGTLIGWEAGGRVVLAGRRPIIVT